jgi:predicted RecA/RadA family phage recombinase
MRNYLSKGDIVTRTAPVGGVTSGVPFILGSEFLVPVATATAGVDVACVKQGKVRLDAHSGDVWTAGSKVFFNATSGECEATDADDNYLIGTAEGAQSGGTVDVVLSGIPLAGDGADLDAKADKTVPTAAGNVAVLTAGGNLEDSEVALDDLALAEDFTGDAGAGGEAGLVPAPAAGDSAAGKYLAADGSWSTPPAGGLTEVAPEDLSDADGSGFAIPLVLSATLEAGVGGNPDDVQVYAVDTLPFPFVVFKVEAAYTAGHGVGQSLEIRTAAGGLGTLVATVGAEDSDDQVLIADPDAVIPGETAGLFVRRSDDALAGVVVLHAAKVASGV